MDNRNRQSNIILSTNDKIEKTNNNSKNVHFFQSKSTMLVRDSSDDYWFLDDEVDDNNDEDDDHEQISVEMGERGISIQTQPAGLAASQQEDDPPFDEEYELESETDGGQVGEEEEQDSVEEVGSGLFSCCWC